MGSLIIRGGQRLEGKIEVDGSKNSVLPILSATVLNGGQSVIKNCPDLKDVAGTLEILRSIGCKVTFEEKAVIVDSSSINDIKIPSVLADQMRSSIVFMGGMLSRFGEVVISYPGGCEIGPRPIDMHLRALKKMGVVVDNVQNGSMRCKVDRLVGCDINLDYPSVGATENIMLTAVFAKGRTNIRNAAKEPEIVDLQNYLNGLGVNVCGAGTSVISIEGNLNKRLSDIEHTVISDRIVAGTYMGAAAITGGDILLEDVVPEHLGAITSNFVDMGCEIKVYKSKIHIKGPKRAKSLSIIRTLPYPGFPTDMQSQFVATLTTASGTSVVVETVFGNRYKYVDELLKMGADIILHGEIAIIKGVKKLVGSAVSAKDLRGGAALVVAGLSADGETLIEGTEHIDRGYVSIQDKLSGVGALITRKS